MFVDDGASEDGHPSATFFSGCALLFHLRRCFGVVYKGSP
jgi:hypothetical protein